MLTLISEGARGDTLNQLNSVLRLPTDQSTFHNVLRINQLSMESNIIDLVVVNNIFVKNKNSISNYFKDTAEDFYSANITEINLLNIEASIKMINKQISDATRGLVSSIISKGVCFYFLNFKYLNIQSICFTLVKYNLYLKNYIIVS